MDEEKNDEFTAEMEARMYAPLEWDSLDICKIQDLKEAHYEEVLRLIKRHYFREEPMCKAVSLLEDEQSVNVYLDFIRIWMKDTTSLVALSSASGRVIGVAITRMNSALDKADMYNRIQNYDGIALEKVMKLINTVIKQTDVYTELNCNAYLRIYILCVHPSYQHKGIGMNLLNICVRVASTLDMPAIGGIFTSGVSQTLALKQGFRIISEIRYSRWIIDDKVVFDDPGKGNYSAAFMGMKILSEEEINKSKNIKQ